MRIALNARHMILNRLEGIGTVTHEAMKRIVKNHPEDLYDYYFDRAYSNEFIHGPNVKGHAFFPPARLPILIRYWMNYPVKRHVNRQLPDLYFSPDGFFPLNLKVPKIAMVHDVAFLRNPQLITPRIRRFYNHWMPVFIKEADHIITVSDFSKGEIISAYGIAPEKISVVYNGVSPDYHPLSSEAKQEVRENYLNGYPYFLYLGAIHPRKNIISLIRAFEQFKDRVQSDFHLVIAGRASWYTAEVFRSVRESVRKDDIHLPGFVEAGAARELIASAHALIYPSRYEGFGLPVIEAMASGVPVMCSSTTSLPEIAGEAALFFDPSDVNQLVDHMIAISEDEALRQKYIALGHQRVKLFSWENAADAMYSIFQKYAG